MEADLLGARAERGELVSVQGTTSGAQGKAARSSKRVVQRAAIAWDTVGYTSDAGADNSSTTGKDFNITYKASEDKTKTLWKLQVDSVKGGADIEMHTDAWRDAFATPPTTEVEAKDAVTAADIRRVANDVLSGPIQMAVIGPFAKSAGFQAAIT